ncbi:MAG: M1 family aminopeptidase, partial [Candidatus Aminicenantales bacterium]
WREFFLAHEIAHQWWGQGVSGATYRDQWLSEGLAQYAAVRYLQAKLGRDVYDAALKKFARWTVKKSKWGPIDLGARLSYLDFDAYQAIVYDKAALVLVMLSDLLGEETFLRGLREFFAAYKFKTARTAQFRAVMEKVSGRDLRPFFDLWFGSHLLPEARVATSARKIGEAFVLQVRVTQKGPAFVFPLWLEWEENGRPVRRMFIVDGAVKEFDVLCAARPTRIKIDPDGRLPGSID